MGTPVSLPDDQVRELARLFPGVQQADEGGVTFFLIPQLSLPAGCTPERVDALLCPTARDGYPSRLFLSEQVRSRSWSTARILERNWYTVSWRIREGLRPAQMVLAHLDAFK